MTNRALLARLAPEKPFVDHESGACLHCGGVPPSRRPAETSRFLSDHQAGCPWVSARQALGDVLPSSREAAFAFLRDTLPLENSALQSLPAEQRALLRWLEELSLVEYTGGVCQPSAQGIVWLVRPLGLRAILQQMTSAQEAVVDLAGERVQAKVRARGKPLRPGATLLAHPAGKAGWDLVPG